MPKFTEHLSRCWRAICAVLYFVFFQLLMSFVVAMMPGLLSQSMQVVFVTLFSSMFTITLLVHLGYVSIEDFRSTVGSKMLLLFVLLQMMTSIGINVIEELCQIPDVLEEVMMGVMANPMGILAVAIIGPVAEELVFRGGLMGGLMKSGYSPKTAIVASALVFGFIHLNPVQVVFASIMGLLLGWAYWRTKSLMPCILMHIANNSFSVLMFYASEDPQGRITDEVGLWLALCLMVSCLINAYFLFKFMDKKLG